MIKIFQNNNLIKALDGTVDDGRIALHDIVLEAINKQENFLNVYPYDDVYDAIRFYEEKIYLLQQLKTFHNDNNVMEFYIDFDRGNSFSKTTVYKIEVNN